MSPTRRDFIKTGVATATSISLLDGAESFAADPFAIEVAYATVNAARGAGASYADARVGRYRRQSVTTRGGRW